MLDKPGTPPSTLTRARAVAVENGIRYAYTGNVHDPKGGSTYCHRCAKLLIERDWYELGEWNLADGKCRFCATPCAGVFEERPGSWGSRRLPVRMSQFA
jgi:pyruvate formate lyase activating enzyme